MFASMKDEELPKERRAHRILAKGLCLQPVEGRNEFGFKLFFRLLC